MLAEHAYRDGCFTVPPKFNFKILPARSRKVTVISFVGECDTILGDRSSLNINNYPDHYQKLDISGPHIDGFYDCERQIIYLILNSINLEDLVQAVNDHRTHIEDFLVSSDHVTLKLLYYLFTVSHFIVVTSVGLGLDVNYIKTFKTLDKMRLKMRHLMDSYLRNLPVPRDWLNTGRASLTKLLFVFKLLPAMARKLSKDVGAVRTLEQNLVNQIFNTFYETGLISNNPGNQLFTLPGHNFVHVLLGNEYPTGIGQKPVVHDSLSQEYLELILHNVGANEYNTKQAKSYFDGLLPPLTTDSLLPPPPSPWDYPPPDQPEEHTLSAFLHLHVANSLDQLANRATGFNQAPLVYELPTCKAWFMACYKLYTSLMSDDAFGADPTPDLAADQTEGRLPAPTTLAQLWQRSLLSVLSSSTVRSSTLPGSLEQDFGDKERRLASDQAYLTDPLYRLSELGCRNALSTAEAHYKKDLPMHYSNTYHLVKVVSAFNLFISLARGRLVFPTLAQLSKRLAHLYLAGRVTCSAVSLTGRLCQHELHRLPDETLNLQSLLAAAASSPGEMMKSHSLLLHQGQYVAPSGAHEWKSRLDNLVPHDLVGKWRRYWLESLANETVSTTPPAKVSSFGDGKNSHTEGTTHSGGVTSQADETKQHLTVMPHRSNWVLVSACGCGRQQAERADPFDVKEANWRFYFVLANMCCNKLTSIALVPQFLCESNHHPFCPPCEFESTQPELPVSDKCYQGASVEVGFVDTGTKPVAVLTRRMASLGVRLEGDGDSEKPLSSRDSLTANQQEPVGAGLSQPEENDFLMLPATSALGNDKDVDETAVFGVPAEDSIASEDSTPLSTSAESSSMSGEKFSNSDADDDEDRVLAGRRRAANRLIPSKSRTASRNTEASSPERSQPVSYTVRFKDGVPASNWLIGEVPRYPSWSIYALGKYFSYSHSSGLSCRGFLRNSNFLLPWDVVIDASSRSMYERGARGGKLLGRGSRFRSNKTDSDTVKLFIGFEMECPLGHRFFLAGPDRPMDGPMQSSQVRRAVHGLLTRNLPLFMPCRCQSSQSTPLFPKRSDAAPPKRDVLTDWHTGASATGTTAERAPIWAQLMRIYLAIPAAPIRVRFQPRVRPGPAKSTPVFHLGHTLDQCEEGLTEAPSDTDNEGTASDDDEDDESIGFTDNKKLAYRKPLFRSSASAGARGRQTPGFVSLDNGFLWVMRLPFAYHDGTHLYPRPTSQPEMKDWCLLRGCIKL